MVYVYYTCCFMQQSREIQEACDFTWLHENEEFFFYTTSNLLLQSPTHPRYFSFSFGSFFFSFIPF